MFSVAGEAGDGETALSMILRIKPAIAVLDVNLPRINGLDLLRRLRGAEPSIACLMLTMEAEEGTFNAAIDGGAVGFITKEHPPEVVLSGLRAAADGALYVCPGLSGFLLRRRERASHLKEERSGLSALTPTERRVLLLVSENKTNKQIAAELFISARTVEAHRTNLCRKLELHGAHKLLQFAIEHRSKL